MIEFKPKHSKNFNPCIEWSDKGMILIHFPDKDINPADDVFAIQQINKMAEYMMDRAKKLQEEITYGDSVADHFELIGHMEPEKREELKTILSILKDAGVEVVEK